MTFIDFHTHNRAAQSDTIAVVDGRDTWGIHPWRADETFAVPDLSGRIAIGECGLDGLRGPSMERQEEVFLQHVRLSEQAGLPLVLHCVKALGRLLCLRRELRPAMPWMLHGFRGKPQQLQSLLAAGFYVSLGFRHNEESLLLCPAGRLMLETDDDGRPVGDIYKTVAEKRGIKVALLCAQMAENYRAFFRKEPFTTPITGDVC